MLTVAGSQVEMDSSRATGSMTRTSPLSNTLASIQAKKARVSEELEDISSQEQATRDTLENLRSEQSQLREEEQGSRVRSDKAQQMIKQLERSLKEASTILQESQEELKVSARKQPILNGKIENELEKAREINARKRELHKEAADLDHEVFKITTRNHYKKSSILEILEDQCRQDQKFARCISMSVNGNATSDEQSYIMDRFLQSAGLGEEERMDVLKHLSTQLGKQLAPPCNQGSLHQARSSECHRAPSHQSPTTKHVSKQVAVHSPSTSHAIVAEAAANEDEYYRRDSSDADSGIRSESVRRQTRPLEKRKSTSKARESLQPKRFKNQ